MRIVETGSDVSYISGGRFYSSDEAYLHRLDLRVAKVQNHCKAALMAAKCRLPMTNYEISKRYPVSGYAARNRCHVAFRFYLGVKKDPPFPFL